MASDYHVTRAAQRVALTNGCERLKDAGVITGYTVEMWTAADGEPMGVAVLEVPGFDQATMVTVQGGYDVSTWEHVRGRYERITSHSGTRCSKEELPDVVKTTVKRAQEQPFSTRESNALRGANWFVNMIDSLLPRERRGKGGTQS